MKKLLTIALLATAVTLSSCSKTETPTPTPVVYTSYKITKVAINQMPFQTSIGTSWDPDNGPDVYFTMIYPVTGNGITSRAYLFPDATPAQIPLVWSYADAIPIDTAADYHFYVYDADDNNKEELIGFVPFSAKKCRTNNYPASITEINNTTQITLYFTYQ